MTINYTDLSHQIKSWAETLGFQQTGIADVDIEAHGERLNEWVSKNYHGQMDYMASHGTKRYRPHELIENTCRVISLRFNYHAEAEASETILDNSDKAFVSRYTLGRDYHKTVRQRLKKLIHQINQYVAEHQGKDEHDYRAFVDSAPVMERAFAEKAGLGWIGKNTMLINKKAGSYFFLSEIYTNLPLPIDEPDDKNHCGRCQSCLTACPTDAFVAPYVLDGRKCISYLTIELKGSIPEALRAKMGNRIFGCDDCQIACPWNRFTQYSTEADFAPRNDLDKSDLIALFNWSEAEFLKKTEGSAIRRTGYTGWLRNIAVALGNATTSIEVIEALKRKQNHESDIVREHVAWALSRHGG